jgi:hypothetical protein
MKPLGMAFVLLVTARDRERTRQEQGQRNSPADFWVNACRESATNRRGRSENSNNGTDLINGGRSH